MKDSLTPEEKLLKLIRGEKKPKKPQGPVLQEVASLPKKTAPASGLTIPSLQKSSQPKKSSLRPFLAIFLVLSALFLLSAFLYPMLDLSRIRLPEVTEEKGRVSESGTPEIKPLESYLEGVQQRQIFRAATVSDVTLPAATAVTNTLDLFKDMTLVGIISSNPPQAVIEDKKTQRTYYLTRGQAIGDLKIDDIQEGKVILDYLGTKYELYM